MPLDSTPSRFISVLVLPPSLKHRGLYVMHRETDHGMWPQADWLGRDGSMVSNSNSSAAPLGGIILSLNATYIKDVCGIKTKILGKALTLFSKKKVVKAP